MSDLSLDEREAIWKTDQDKLRKELIERDDLEGWDFDIIESEGKRDERSRKKLKYIGGVDISFVKDSETDACACLVVLSYPDLEVVYERLERIDITVPYINGFLAFREVDHIIKLIEELRNNSEKSRFFPDIIMVDGNGILHPRGFGLASHLGVVTNIPTIGVGKNLNIIDGLTKVDIKEKMDKNHGTDGIGHIELVGDSGRVWGAACRALDGLKSPIFISIGHMISLETAIDLTYKVSRFRIPEPVRQADLRSREMVRTWLENENS